jgi:hypothetical protein
MAATNPDPTPEPEAERRYRTAGWLRDRSDEGLGVPEIAESEDVHATTVYYWLERHGLEPPNADRDDPSAPHRDRE